MNEKEFKSYMDILADYLKSHLHFDVMKSDSKNTNATNDLNTLKEVQGIFLRALQLQCTIAKIFYSIGYVIFLI